MKVSVKVSHIVSRYVILLNNFPFNIFSRNKNRFLKEYELGIDLFIEFERCQVHRFDRILCPD